MQKTHSSSEEVETQQTRHSPEQMRIDFDYVPTWWSSRLVATLLSRLRNTAQITTEVAPLTRGQVIQKEINTSIAEAARRLRSPANKPLRRDADIDGFEQVQDKAASEALVNREEEYGKKRA